MLNLVPIHFAAALASGGTAPPPPAPYAPQTFVADAVMTMESELHFQEGFDGETVVVAVDGAEVAHFMARTRMQISLAHVEKLRLKSGQTVTIRLPDKGILATHEVEAEKLFIQIVLEGGALRIQSTESSPGYL